MKFILVTLLQNRDEYEKMPSVYERPTNESHSSMTTLRQPQFDTSFASRLASMNLDAVMAHVAAETGLKGADLARAEELYRQFLTLKARYPETAFVPPKLVDEVWHTHITFTRQYFADCELLFGEYLHHRPEGTQDSNDALFFNYTVPMYKRDFGTDLLAYGVQDARYVTASFCP